MFSLVRRGSLIPNNYFTQSLEPYGMLNRMARWGDSEQAQWFSPALDAKETNDAYVFEIDVPGVRDEDLNVSLDNYKLTISGKREGGETKEGEAYCACERSYGTFSRSVTLPESVDTESVTADLKHGVLTVSVSKKPEVKPKQISISAS